MAEHRQQHVFRPIEDYGLIGNSHTAALVSSEGSIDWLCQPRFDSPSVFARLLDLHKGGHWKISPISQHHGSNSYVESTNVLRTRFLTPEGVVHVLDFMPVHESQHEFDSPPMGLIRIIEGIEGTVEMESECVPRPNYSRTPPKISVNGGELSFDGCSISGPGEWKHDESAEKATSRVTVHAHERLTFVLRFGDGIGLSDAEDALDQTIDYWRNWANQCTYEGPYRNEVIRSALTIRLLMDTPTGAIVAAPTASLPERFGGDLNWDYRYTWIRDASLSLYALLLAGFIEEDDEFFNWILKTVKVEKTGIRIMYPISPEGKLEEQELNHFYGYRGSRPVRIGNGAHGQLQLDVYGEVMDALFFAWKVGRYDPAQVWDHFLPLVDWIADNWDQPDNGIWEVRGERHHYVYSKVMSWVALDRGIKIANQNNLPGDTDRWKRERAKIRAEVLEKGWSEKLGAFKQTYDGDREQVDASNLRISPVGFLEGDDPKMVSTINRTIDRLVTNQLCYRYLSVPSTEITGSEGTFITCTFWLINALIMAGEHERAKDMFENVLHYSSPLGLYAEEMDPSSRAQIGNYPQALSHIGLISAAVSLAQVGVTGTVEQEQANAASNARASGRHTQED